MCHARMKKANPYVKIANVPKASTYCSICLTDDAFSRNILSTKTCIPIHDPVKRNQKRKRDDPFCMCWEEHLREKHPMFLSSSLPSRVTSPVNEK